jgi:DNA-binding NarL/FixJ family response regulator
MSKRSDVGDTACAYRRTGADPIRDISRLKTLTDREKEVLLLLGTGLGNRQLARELGIAERTVKAHVARIVEKLDQQTRLQVAVLSVLAHELLCTDPRCACGSAAPRQSLVGASLVGASAV